MYPRTKIVKLNIFMRKILTVQEKIHLEGLRQLVASAWAGSNGNFIALGQDVLWWKKIV